MNKKEINIKLKNRFEPIIAGYDFGKIKLASDGGYGYRATGTHVDMMKGEK